MVVGHGADGEAEVLELGVHQPAVVQPDADQVEHDALGRVLEILHRREPDTVQIQEGI